MSEDSYYLPQMFLFAIYMQKCHVLPAFPLHIGGGGGNQKDQYLNFLSFQKIRGWLNLPDYKCNKLSVFHLNKSGETRKISFRLLELFAVWLFSHINKKKKYHLPNGETSVQAQLA